MTTTHIPSHGTRPLLIMIPAAARSALQRQISGTSRLVRTLVIMCCMVNALSADETPDGIIYLVDGNTVTITGYIGSGGAVDIPAMLPSDGTGKPVTRIEDGAFYFCDTMTSVTIPSGVTSIGDDAFGLCSGLTGVLTIPAHVTSIGKGAFADCSKLTGITIPGGVTHIQDSTFQNCAGLTSVTLPPGVTSIGDYAFYGCGLTGVLSPHL